MATKGYGFSVDDIDMMNPELLKPYVDAYKAEWKQRDMEMYMWFGRYATSALVTAIDATFGKGNSKYVKKTCYDSIEKHNTDDPDAEIREMLKAEEAWASVKAIPCSASLTMLGVWILDSGLKAEMSP